MANNRNKFIQDIRRIVKIDINQKQLGAADTRPSLDAKKGISFNTNIPGSPSGVSGGADLNGSRYFKQMSSGVLTANNDTNSAESEYDQGNNTNDPTQQGQSSYNYDEGTFTIIDVIDDAAGTPSIPDLTPTGLLGQTANNGGTLNGLTGLTDQATGKDFEIRFDGQDRPPRGWYNANTPDTDPYGPLGYITWQSGLKWVGQSLGLPESGIAQEAAEAARDDSGSGAYTELVTQVLDTSFPHTGGNSRWIFTFKRPSLAGTVDYYAYDVTCTPGSSASCPVANPITSWPADDTAQLIRTVDNQLFITSDFEPPADRITAFLDGQHGTVNFTFDSGGRYGSIYPAINGGYIITETDTYGGTPIGVQKLFTSQNKLAGYLTPTTYSKYLPKG